MVMRSFLFMFSLRSAIQGNMASAKSRNTAYATVRCQSESQSCAPPRGDNVQQTMKAMVAMLRWHFLLYASRGFQTDSAGVHCAKTAMQVRMLRMEMVMMQIQRNHLCLDILSANLALLLPVQP
jgi:hypothetical protein